ncbi:hypothetical protein [Mesorhizobium escarrei]|uniref:Uncharacterized protein n=1 Tax=Mesorhizobium escarrei TaxID=666018 RepID=A0ABN8JCZ4_9HYPH|nr:hypothetical protein [Mesorhizobium escarrei]CAH2395386.1 conserved exported hypothetical protein [Mesorhizobium escarrei]
MKPFAFLPITLLGALAVAAPAAAQTDNETQNQAPAGHCQAQPQNDLQQTPPVNNGDSLTDTLDPCNGVLLPPPTGDQGMAAPPPDEGKTPVLKPGEVPPQPPKQ